MALRLDLEGLRVRMPGTSEVYVIDGGKRRLVPSEVYSKLFMDISNIHADPHLDLIDLGVPVPTTAMLFTEQADEITVYFLDGTEPKQTKRHVANPAVMTRYNFDWARVQRKITKKYDAGPALTKEGSMG